MTAKSEGERKLWCGHFLSHGLSYSSTVHKAVVLFIVELLDLNWADSLDRWFCLIFSWQTPVVDSALMPCLVLSGEEDIVVSVFKDEQQKFRKFFNEAKVYVSVIFRQSLTHN